MNVHNTNVERPLQDPEAVDWNGLENTVAFINIPVLVISIPQDHWLLAHL